MKILCIADIHGDREAAKKARLYAEANGIDTLLILGDFPGYGVFHNIEQSIKEVEETLNIFNGLHVLAIPGNCDPQKTPEIFEKRGVNLHEKIRALEGVKVIGFGGSNVTPFETPFEMEEDEIYSRLEALLRLVSDGNVIIAVHCPPKDTRCDQIGGGLHAGSSSIRKVVEEFKPGLVVCSHIHEAGGASDRIGPTGVANIGRLSNGSIGVIDIGKEVSLTLLNIGK